jgi:predicted secreted protein
MSTQELNSRVVGKDVKLYAPQVPGQPWHATQNPFVLVAGQREGGFDITRESIDVTTKLDWEAPDGKVGNGMRQFKQSFGSWKATLGGIVTYDNPALSGTLGDYCGANLLSQCILDGTSIQIRFQIGDKTYGGEAMLNSFNRSGALAGEATYTADLQGSGFLDEVIGTSGSGVPTS